ncbi:MAG: MATE family efflux transporter [Fidelibacterota bacterium]
MLSNKKKNKVSGFIKNPHRALWQLSVPIMFGMAVQTIYSLVDMVFIGRLGGEAIAALSFTMPLLFFAIGITFGLGSGVTSVISRFLGANAKKDADNSAEHGVLMGIVFGVILSVGGYLLRYSIFEFLGATPEIIPLAVDYFSVIVMGFIFHIMNVFFRSILSGEGDTVTPIRFQITGTLLNVMLDPLFIFTLNLGIRGAALATVFSQFVVMVLFLNYLFKRKQSYIHFRFSEFHFSFSLLREIFRIGIPASMAMFIMSLGGMVFNRLLIRFGAEAVAAFGIARNLDQVFHLPIMSMANGMVTLAGMFYGAGEYEKIRKTWYYAISRGIFIAVSIGILFYLGAPYIYRIFSSDKEILSIAIQYTRLLVFVYPFIVVSMISGRIFQGLGRGLPGLILTSLRVVFISILFAIFFVIYLEKPLHYIWYSNMISSVLAGSLAFVWLRYRLRRLEESRARLIM